MRELRRGAVLLGVAAALAGCVAGRPGGLASSAAPVPTTGSVPAASTAVSPPVVAPANPADGLIETRFVVGRGMIVATRQVLAGIDRPLRAQPGPNRTVEPCRQAALVEAQRLGATQVEAASAGAEKVDGQGRATAPVLVRITYPGALSSEVREAVITCTVDRSGRLVDSRA